MAKWEEKHPRWLVEDRPDGANVNRWHWEEKSLHSWCKERLHSLTVGTRHLFILDMCSLFCPGTTRLAADMDKELGEAVITGIKSLEGDAYLTQRKGNRKFVVFDTTITLAWAGKWVADDPPGEVAGTISIAEAALDNDESEYVFHSSAEGVGAAQDALSQAMQALKPAIYARLALFFDELRQLQAS